MIRRPRSGWSPASAPRTVGLAISLSATFACAPPTIGGVVGGPECPQLETESDCLDASPVASDGVEITCRWVDARRGPRGDPDCSGLETVGLCVPAWTVSTSCATHPYCPLEPSPRRFWTRSDAVEATFELPCGVEPFGTEYAQCGEGNAPDATDYPEVPACECECSVP